MVANLLLVTPPGARQDYKDVAVSVAVNKSTSDVIMLTVSESFATNLLGSGFHTSV